MKKVLVLLAASIIFIGCATTKLALSWRDPDFQPNSPQKAVVIAVLKNDGIRRRVEEAFVNQLQKENVAGVASYSFMPDQKMDNQAILKEVARLGADLIIVSTVVDRQTKETYVPPTATTSHALDPGFYGYYSARVETIYAPGYVMKSEQAISELKAFNAKDQKLIWSATATTAIDGGVSEAGIDEFCKKATQSLLKGRQARKG